MSPSLGHDLDGLLRTTPSPGPEPPDDGPGFGRILLLIGGLGAIAGTAIGLHGVLQPGPAGTGDALQVVATALKVPALFLGSVLVTLPSFYVFNALLGPGLGWRMLTRTSLRGVTVMLAVLASLAPIIVFFEVGTTSYAFIKLLVAAGGLVSGLLGVRWLRSTLDSSMSPVSRPVLSPDDLESPAWRPAGGRWLIWIWITLFAFVGSQMAWILRPFIGSPDTPFTWFRPAGGTLLQDLGRTMLELLGG